MATRNVETYRAGHEAFNRRDFEAMTRQYADSITWDLIFYPDGVGAWMAKLDADLDNGGIAADPRFFPNGDDFRGLRVHQTRLQGGDASSDSYWPQQLTLRRGRPCTSPPPRWWAVTRPG